jgi:hypothetical protein
MRALRILVLAAFGLISPTLLRAQWNEGGAPVPNTSWRKSEGDFGAMLVLTDKPDEFFRAWETETPGASIAATEVARRGSPVVGVVVFTGCAPNENGLCDATVVYTVIKPDGTVYDKPQEGELWIGKRPPAKYVLQLSLGNMGVVIEPEDPLGRYLMHAEVRDRVSGKVLHLERHFDAIEK